MPIIVSGPSISVNGASATEPYIANFRTGVIGFDVAAISPTGTALTYTWDFGDGLRASGQKVSHRYDGGETQYYVAAVTVSDGTRSVTSAPIKIKLTKYEANHTEFITPELTTGKKSFLLIIANYSDETTARSVDDATKKMNDVSATFSKMTFGQLSLTTTAVFITLPHNKDYYTKPEKGFTSDMKDRILLADARKVAREQGYATEKFDLDAVYHTRGISGSSNAGTKGCWFSNLGFGSVGHEQGHNFGLDHAHAWLPCSADPIGPADIVIYGDPFDTMACNPGRFNAYESHRLKWLRANSINNLTKSSTCRLFSLNSDTLKEGNIYAYTIPKDLRNYWIEYLPHEAGDSAAVLHWSPWGYSRRSPQFLHMKPQINLLTKGGLNIGQTFADRISNIFVTPTASGTFEGQKYIDLEVKFGPFPGNNAPVATLTCPASLSVSQAAEFSVSAKDPDNDAMTYFWDFGDATYNTVSAPKVTKSWATAGDYVVRCAVSDMKGGVTYRSKAVTVGDPGTYRITGKITSDGQPMQGVLVKYCKGEPTIPPHLKGGYFPIVHRPTETLNWALTDSDGTYTLSGLAAGSYTVTADNLPYNFEPSGFSNPVTISTGSVTCDFSRSGTIAPPTIAAIPDVVIDEDSRSAPIRYTVKDANVPMERLLVLQSSSNPELIPPDNISFSHKPSNSEISEIVPKPLHHGTSRITLTVSNGLLSSSTSFNVTVKHVNHAPTAANQHLTTASATPVPVTLSAIDVDGEAVTYSVVKKPDHGALSGTSPNLKYTPDSGFEGDDYFAFKANDGICDGNQAAVVITVNPPAR